METELSTLISFLTLNLSVLALAGAVFFQAWTERRKVKDDDDNGGEGGAPACP